MIAMTVLPDIETIACKLLNTDKYSDAIKMVSVFLSTAKPKTLRSATLLCGHNLSMQFPVPKPNIVVR